LYSCCVNTVGWIFVGLCVGHVSLGSAVLVACLFVVPLELTLDDCLSVFYGCLMWFPCWLSLLFLSSWCECCCGNCLMGIISNIAILSFVVVGICVVVTVPFFNVVVIFVAGFICVSHCHLSVYGCLLHVLHMAQFGVLVGNGGSCFWFVGACTDFSGCK